MRDCIEIGPTPSGEDCEQLGPNYDRLKARKECKAFENQLRRAFPELNGNEKTWTRIRSENHDFGTYYEVAVSFDSNDEDSIELAFRIESESPEYWDAEAKAELGLIPS